MWVLEGFGGSGGSVCVMGEWSVGQWIVGVISFKKIYGLYGLKHHIVAESRLHGHRCSLAASQFP